MVMDVVQSVESAPVRAAGDAWAVMMFPVVKEGKVVVPGVQPEDQKRCGIGGTDEAEEFPDRE